jgi:hypothetical protein
VSGQQNKLGNFISYWGISPHDSCSDHELIEVHIETVSPEPILRRSYKNLDWEEFAQGVTTDSLSWSPEPLATIALIEREIDSFNTGVITTLDKIAPLHEIKNKDKIVDIWYVDEMETLREQCRVARRRVRRSKNSERELELREESRLLRNELTNMIKKAKKDSWRSMVSEVEDLAGMARLVRIFKKSPRHQVGLLRDPATGNFTKTPEDSVNLLMDTHFRGSRPILEELHQTDAEHEFLSDVQGPEVLISYPWVTEELIVAAAKEFKPMKREGKDGIKPCLLQHLPYLAISRLLWIFTACIQLKYIPRIWRLSEVIFLPKPHKEDCLPKAFRPISLTSFVFKTFEKLNMWHLESTHMVNFPMHPHQHGFRKGFGTESAAARVINKAEQYVLSQKVALGVAIDVEGAFDNVKISYFVALLRRRGLPEQFIGWYSFFLENRISQTTIKNIIVSREISKGFPQGSPLSSPSWNFTLED